ncbi:MAG: glutamate--tRNA ligase family protein, partial [Bacteroidota bacterium]
TPYMGYKESGYYPEAFVNILALLGWNPGNNEELFSLEELSALFDFERVNKSGAKFDPEKAKWFNQQYLRKHSDADLANAFKPILHSKGIERSDAFLAEFCKLMKEKVHFVHEFWEQGHYVFEAKDDLDEKVMAKKWNDKSKALFTLVQDSFITVSDWQTQVLHDTFEELVKVHGKIDMQLLRVLITGVAGGPQLFDLLALLGKDEVLARLGKSLGKLN